MAEKEFDIISIGDATIDHFIFFHDASVNCEIKPEICQLCFNYADKLPVDKYSSLVAGNAANNAVGSSRLGLKTAIYTVLGDDEGGHRIKEKLISEGADPNYIAINKDDETNNSFVLSFQGERTIFVYHVKHIYKLPELGRTQWIYLTSTGQGYENLFREVLEVVKKQGIKLAYNPGTYQLRGDVAIMSEVIKSSEVVFLNVEEAQHIVGTKDRDVKVLLNRIRDMGAGIAVITDGHEGAYAYDGRHYLHLQEFSHDRLETTGAGDAFGTGFVAALHYGEPVSEAMRWASINANSVVQKIGPQAGLLTREVVLQRLRSNSDYLPKII